VLALIVVSVMRPPLLLVPPPELLLEPELEPLLVLDELEAINLLYRSSVAPSIKADPIQTESRHPITIRPARRYR
jgi:hypothetical protein